MLISVIIPAYNCIESLKSTVESILSSGLADYEILIIDDGSTDGTSSACDELSAALSNINCIHKKNAGVSAARNTGLENAKGEYVFFFDADDTVEPNSLKNAESIIKKHHPDMLMFGMNFDYYHKGRRYRRESLVYHEEGIMTLEDVKNNFFALYDCNMLTPVWNKIINREMLIRNGVRFDTSLIIMEDFLFTLNALVFCNKIYSLPEAIYCYKQEDEWSKAYERLKKIKNIEQIMQKIETSLNVLCVSNKEVLIKRIYLMLLEQKMHLSSMREIKEIISTHKSRKYSSVAEFENVIGIYFMNRYKHFRHKCAVVIRYMLSNRKLEMSDFQKDLYRYYGNDRSLRTFLIVPLEIKYLKIFRRYQASKKLPVKKFYGLRLLCLSRRTQIQIPGNTSIGPGFYIGHCGRIIINSKAVIGSNVNIATGVTIGQENRGKRKGCPVIGNNVWIGTNAVIVGNVHIGDDTLIAPLSYVNFDVPDHSIVIGNPAKINSSENATRGYIENTV